MTEITDTELVAEARRLSGMATGFANLRALMLPLAERVESLTAEKWDGTWRRHGQTEDEERKALATWTKAQLITHIILAGQREIQEHGAVLDRVDRVAAERDVLQAKLDAVRAGVDFYALGQVRRELLAILDGDGDN